MCENYRKRKEKHRQMRDVGVNRLRFNMGDMLKMLGSDAALPALTVGLAPKHYLNTSVPF